MGIVRMEINVDKSGRGWSVQTIAHWEGWNNPAVTNAGYSTLASALWHSIDRNDPAGEYVIMVKGEPMSSERAYQIIEKDLSKSVLSYALPAYACALRV